MKNQRSRLIIVHRLNYNSLTLIELEVKFAPVVHPNKSDSGQIAVENLVDTTGKCVRG